MTRTTIELPEDLHRCATEIARETSRSLSETVADSVRRGLDGEPRPSKLKRSRRTGLLVLDLGKTVTPEDVRQALDEDDE